MPTPKYVPHQCHRLQIHYLNEDTFTYLASLHLLKFISPRHFSQDSVFSNRALSKVGGKGTSREYFMFIYFMFLLGHPNLTCFLSSCPEEQKNSCICLHLLLFIFMHFSIAISTGICMAQPPKYSRNIMCYVIFYFRLNFITQHIAFSRDAELFLGS